jgi:leucyl aminopeptidase (aminopeptidase T)
MSNKINKAIQNIFKINIRVKKTEKVVVFTDGYSKELRDIGKRFAEEGKKFAKEVIYIEYPSTGCHGIEPPEDIWKEVFGMNVHIGLKRKKLLKPLLSKKITKNNIKLVEGIIEKYKKEAFDVVIALSYFSTTHTRFRDMLNKICGTRYASMPLFDKPMLTGAMGVHWQEMLERTRYIAKRVNSCEGVQIETRNGTSLTLSKKTRDARMDTGIITKPGSFSNLPAGEVFLAPLEGTSNGRLVLEWAPTHKLKKPITLHVKKGLVTEIKGKEKYIHYLEEKLSERKENRNIAELGIGTNNKASRPDNILESEKIFGTIHVALGDNSSFGGKVRTSFHQDFVFFKPTITLIYKNGRKRMLMKNGSLQRRQS